MINTFATLQINGLDTDVCQVRKTRRPHDDTRRHRCGRHNWSRVVRDTESEEQRVIS